MGDADSERRKRRSDARLNLIFVLIALGFSALFDGLAMILLPNNPIGKILDGVIFLIIAAILLGRWLKSDGGDPTALNMPKKQTSS